MPTITVHNEVKERYWDEKRYEETWDDTLTRIMDGYEGDENGE